MKTAKKLVYVNIAVYGNIALPV